MNTEYIVREYGYEYDATIDEDIMNRVGGKSTHETFMGATAFRCGRDALKAIAQRYKNAVALIPALACDSMFTPFEMNGHEVRFYPYDEAFHIQIEPLQALIDERSTLFLYMDYFGNKAIDDDELEQLQKAYPQMVFVEDRTHNLLIEKNRAFVPDYTVASLRKWINIPDGGLLWCHGSEQQSEIDEDTNFSEKRLYAQCLRNEYFHTGNEEIKKQYRSIFSHLDGLIDTKEPYRMSAYAMELAKRADWGRVKDQRRKNAEVLIQRLKNNQHVKFVQPNAGQSDLYVELLVERRDEIQSRLSAKGVFCTIIWPLCDRQRKACAWSKYVEEHMLAAPCDQRYDESDMIYIAAEINRVVNEVLEEE